MNSMSKIPPDSDLPTSLRAQSKLKTRRRVLDAARQLFMERGYEAATIRDIASEAGLSTGAVIAEDFQRQVEALRGAAKPDAKVEDAVLAVFEAGYRFHGAQLPLLQAAV